MRYYLGNKYPGIYFTYHEAVYMFYCIKGLVNKEIAVKMQLSPRTLNFYCDNMRRLLQCKNRRMLVQKVILSDFMRYLPELKLGEEER